MIFKLQLKLFIILICSSSFAGGSAKQVLENLRKNSVAPYEFAELSMTVFKKGDELKRELSIRKMDKKNEVRSLVKIHSPKRVEGMGVFSEIKDGGQETQWLFIPSLKKSRRILKGNKKSSFLDSHLNYEDFSADMYKSYSNSILKEDKKRIIILSKPKSKEATYSKIETTVSKRNYLVLKTRYFRKSKLVKTLTAKKYKKFGKTWRAGLITVQMSGSKDRTELKLKKFSTKKFEPAKVSKRALEG
ncbi:MAG: outer membrane lipoprotein-sorting protein [Bdellovibrionales bacterium]